MTRVKSFYQGIKQVATPYESYRPLKKSSNHRIHRSKKNRNRNVNDNRYFYKKRLEELKLENDD